MTKPACALLISALLMAPPAGGELQNVIVNGFSVMKVEDRRVEVIQALPGNLQDPNLSAIRLFNDARYAKHESQIATLKTSLPSDARIALSFYLGMPAPKTPEPADVHFEVRVNGLRVFQSDQIEPGWRHCLIDLGAWRRQDGVAVSFSTFWMRGASQQPVLLALPRVVAWRGPYYTGWGGISSGAGRHGRQHLGPAQTIQVDRSKLSGGALAIYIFDFVNTSAVRMRSARQERILRAGPGECWASLALGDDAREEVETVLLNGEAESGAVDVIPNFLAEDGPKLKQIEEAEAARK